MKINLTGVYINVNNYCVITVFRTIVLHIILSKMDVNVLNDHIHQLQLLICCMLRGRCVSSDEDCLTPRAPTGADVSFFSTLGCSLRGALTSGSMALALLSPFIWSERALAPVLVCRWPSFHLASSLSLSSPDSWLPQPAADRRQVLGLPKCMHALHKHTHTLLQREPVMHLDADATHPHFFFPLTHTPPRLFLCPRLSVYPSVSPALTLCLGFLASSLGLWSQEEADHLVGGEPAVGQSGSDVSLHP